jgi:hypothetical protein
MGEVACGERKRAFLDLYLFPSLTFISLARPAFFSLSQSSALARQMGIVDSPRGLPSTTHLLVLNFDDVFI